ncbi:unnamed protein product [Amoebophrya sp. A120]|nr:unnamed protein product [Amoebophrya sp. A120]|eukprot:GSA120T00009904001.1
MASAATSSRPAFGAKRLQPPGGAGSAAGATPGHQMARSRSNSRDQTAADLAAGAGAGGSDALSLLSPEAYRDLVNNLRNKKQPVMHPVDWLGNSNVPLEQAFPSITLQQLDFCANLFALLFENNLSYCVYIGETSTSERLETTASPASASGSTASPRGSAKAQQSSIEIESRAIPWNPHPHLGSLRDIRKFYEKCENSNMNSFEQIHQLISGRSTSAKLRATDTNPNKGCLQVEFYKVWITLHGNGRCDAGVMLCDVYPSPFVGFSDQQEQTDEAKDSANFLNRSVNGTPAAAAKVAVPANAHLLEKELLPLLDCCMWQHEDCALFLQHIAEEDWRIQDLCFSLYRPNISCLSASPENAVVTDITAGGPGGAAGGGAVVAAATAAAGSTVATKKDLTPDLLASALFFYEKLGFEKPKDEVILELIYSRPEAMQVKAEFGKYGLLKMNITLEMKSSVHTEVILLPLIKAMDAKPAGSLRKKLQSTVEDPAEEINPDGILKQQQRPHQSSTSNKFGAVEQVEEVKISELPLLMYQGRQRDSSSGLGSAADLGPLRLPSKPSFLSAVGAPSAGAGATEGTTSNGDQTASSMLGTVGEEPTDSAVWRGSECAAPTLLAAFGKINTICQKCHAGFSHAYTAFFVPSLDAAGVSTMIAKIEHVTPPHEVECVSVCFLHKRR